MDSHETQNKKEMIELLDKALNLADQLQLDLVAIRITEAIALSEKDSASSDFEH